MGGEIDGWMIKTEEKKGKEMDCSVHGFRNKDQTPLAGDAQSAWSIKLLLNTNIHQYQLFVEISAAI